MLPVDLIVLAGGRGSRLGGALKPAVEVAGRALLSRVLDARALAEQAVVVGPSAARLAAIDEHGRAVSVIWALENPPFGGPVAGLAAGLAALDAAHDATLDAAHVAADAERTAPAADGALRHPLKKPADWVLVLACDLPWAAKAARQLHTHVSALAARGKAENVDGVHFVDDRGRAQWLAAIYRASALRSGVTRLGDQAAGASMRQLLDGLSLTPLKDEFAASADVDTWEDVESTTAHLSGSRSTAIESEEREE